MWEEVLMRHGRGGGCRDSFKGTFEMGRERQVKGLGEIASHGNEVLGKRTGSLNRWEHWS